MSNTCIGLGKQGRYARWPRSPLALLPSESLRAFAIITTKMGQTDIRPMLCVFTALRDERGICCRPVSVCLCLSQVGVLSKRMDESSWFLAWELPLTCSTLFATCNNEAIPPQLRPKLWT